ILIVGESGAERELLVEGHVRQCLACHLDVPSVGRSEVGYWASDCTTDLDRLSRRMIGEDCRNFAEPLVHTRLLPPAGGGSRKVVGSLLSERLAGSFGLAPPMNGFDDLLRAERDEHAEHDDPNLAGELAPAVQRLGEMDVHVRAPSAGSVPEGPMSAMAGIADVAAAAIRVPFCWLRKGA